MHCPCFHQNRSDCIFLSINTFNSTGGCKWPTRTYVIQQLDLFLNCINKQHQIIKIANQNWILHSERRTMIQRLDMNRDEKDFNCLRQYLRVKTTRKIHSIKTTTENSQVYRQGCCALARFGGKSRCSLCFEKGKVSPYNLQRVKIFCWSYYLFFF